MNRTIKSAQRFLDKTKDCQVDERSFPSVCKHVKHVLDDFEKTGQEIQRSRDGERGRALADFFKDVTQTVVARLKTQSKKKNVVCTLQEIKKTMPSCAFQKNNFEVVWFEDTSLQPLADVNIKHDHMQRMDTAVAVPKKAFKDIENQSFSIPSDDGKPCDAAVAVATHRKKQVKSSLLCPPTFRGSIL